MNPVQMLDTQDVARLLKVNQSTVNKLAHEGKIPAIDIGRKKQACFRFHPEDIAAYQRRLTFNARCEKRRTA